MKMCSSYSLLIYSGFHHQVWRLAQYIPIRYHLSEPPYRLIPPPPRQGYFNSHYTYHTKHLTSVKSPPRQRPSSHTVKTQVRPLCKLQLQSHPFNLEKGSTPPIPLGHPECVFFILAAQQIISL